MRNSYRICIINSLNHPTWYRITAYSLAQAVALAQTKGGVASTVEPIQTGNDGLVDVEAPVTA